MTLRVSFIQDPIEVQPPEMAVFMGAVPAYDPNAASAESRRLASVLRSRRINVVSPMALLDGRHQSSVPHETLRCLAHMAVRANKQDRQALSDAAIAAWDQPALARLVVTQPELEMIADKTLRHVSPDSHYESYRIMPLFGLMFPRDHFIATRSAVIPGRMVRSDRQREGAVMTACLAALGAYIKELPKDDSMTLEGGDFACNSDVSIINCGFRTAPRAAEWLANSGLIDTDWLLILHDHLMQPEEFHLDHFLALGPGLALVAHERLDSRRAVSCQVLQRNNMGFVAVAEELTLRQALNSVDVDILELTVDEKRQFAANVLFFGEDLMIAADTVSDRVTDTVRSRGIEVASIAFREHHKQFGSVHCAAHPFDIC